jgi:hypothetical protein
MSERVPADFEPHQEEDVVKVRTLVIVAIVSLVVGGIGVFFGGVTVVAATGRLQPDFAGPRGQQPAPPEISHVEQTPADTARRGPALNQEQRRALDEWGWVDRQRGIAKIPIEQAIDLVAREQAR